MEKRLCIYVGKRYGIAVLEKIEEDFLNPNVLIEPVKIYACLLKIMVALVRSYDCFNTCVVICESVPETNGSSSSKKTISDTKLLGYVDQIQVVHYLQTRCITSHCNSSYVIELMLRVILTMALLSILVVCMAT